MGYRGRQAPRDFLASLDSQVYLGFQACLVTAATILAQVASQDSRAHQASQDFLEFQALVAFLGWVFLVLVDFQALVVSQDSLELAVFQDFLAHQDLAVSQDFLVSRVFLALAGHLERQGLAAFLATAVTIQDQVVCQGFQVLVALQGLAAPRDSQAPPGFLGLQGFQASLARVDFLVFLVLVECQDSVVHRAQVASQELLGSQVVAFQGSLGPLDFRARQVQVDFLVRADFLAHQDFRVFQVLAAHQARVASRGRADFQAPAAFLELLALLAFQALQAFRVLADFLVPHRQLWPQRPALQQALFCLRQAHQLAISPFWLMQACQLMGAPMQLLAGLMVGLSDELLDCHPDLQPL